MHLIKQLNNNLLNIAWSLWTELGVAGTKKIHGNALILIEELVIFTSVLSEIDPRLRDESSDWCATYHHYISISRLKSLINDFDESAQKSFSQYASSVNNISRANLPVLIDTTPLHINLSHKSVLRPHSSPGLLNIRARSIFGTGARADLMTFFLVHANVDFSIAEVAEIGYSKRNFAEILEDLYFGNLFSRFMQGNQKRYQLHKKEPLFSVLKPTPEYAPLWRSIFKILISLRDCIQRTDRSAETTKVIEICNCLKANEKLILKLKITPPCFQNNFTLYLETFSQWLLEWTSLDGKYLLGTKNDSIN